MLGELKSRLQLVTKQIVLFQQKRWRNKEWKRKTISLQQIACHWIILHKAGFVWVGGKLHFRLCVTTLLHHVDALCVCVCVRLLLQWLY